jgi:hypothetical protein
MPAPSASAVAHEGNSKAADISTRLRKSAEIVADCKRQVLPETPNSSAPSAHSQGKFWGSKIRNDSDAILDDALTNLGEAFNPNTKEYWHRRQVDRPRTKKEKNRGCVQEPRFLQALPLTLKELGISKKESVKAQFLATLRDVITIVQSS